MQLHINTPCDTPWQDMQPSPGGRHCSSCAKTVIDFTMMSDAQIVRFLKHSSSGTCGRLSAAQLNRPLAVPIFDLSETRWLSQKLRLALAAIGLASTATLQAQNGLATQLGTSTYVQPYAPATPTSDTPRTEVAAAHGIRFIHGKVVDERGQAMISALIYTDDYAHGTPTDIDGFFELELPGKYTNISVSYIGYQTASIALPLKDSVIKLEYNSRRIDVDLACTAIMPASQVILAGGVGYAVTSYNFLGLPINFRAIPQSAKKISAWTSRNLKNLFTPVEDKDFVAPSSSAAGPTESLVLSPAAARLFPNPSSGVVTILLPEATAAPMLLNIYDALGRLVYAQAIPSAEAQIALDLSNHLPAGLYRIELSGSQGLTLHQLTWVIE